MTPRVRVLPQVRAVLAICAARNLFLGITGLADPVAYRLLAAANRLVGWYANVVAWGVALTLVGLVAAVAVVMSREALVRFAFVVSGTWTAMLAVVFGVAWWRGTATPIVFGLLVALAVKDVLFAGWPVQDRYDRER